MTPVKIKSAQITPAAAQAVGEWYMQLTSSTVGQADDFVTEVAEYLDSRADCTVYDATFMIAIKQLNKTTLSFDQLNKLYKALYSKQERLAHYHRGGLANPDGLLAHSNIARFARLFMEHMVEVHNLPVELIEEAIRLFIFEIEQYTEQFEVPLNRLFVRCRSNITCERIAELTWQLYRPEPIR